MGSNNTGAYIPTTNVWDTSEIYNTEVTSPQFKELLVRLYQNLNQMAIGVNNRDAALYDTQEFVCGQQFFPDPSLTSQSTTVPTMRQVYRKVINFGALGNGNKSVAHGITVTTGTIFTRMYGVATDPVNKKAITIPRRGVIGITYTDILVDATNVTISTGADLSDYSITYVILEYIK